MEEIGNTKKNYNPNTTCQTDYEATATKSTELS